MPGIYEQSPQQVVRQKMRRITQANTDRRAMESLPNPQNINDSLEYPQTGYVGGQVIETMTPNRFGPSKFKQIEAGDGPIHLRKKSSPS